MRYSRFSRVADIMNLWWFFVSIISPIQSIVDLLLLHVVRIFVLFCGENSSLPGVSANLETIFFWKKWPRGWLKLMEFENADFGLHYLLQWYRLRLVRSTVCRSRKGVGHGLPSSTVMDPGTWISLSPGSCQRFLRHRMPEIPAEIQTLW